MALYLVIDVPILYWQNNDAKSMIYICTDTYT